MLALASLLLLLVPGSGAPPASEPASAPGQLVAPTSPTAIVGGEPVEPGEHPAVVAVGFGLGECTGTLLTPELVLTAAHCLVGLSQPDLVQIQLGEDDDAPTQRLGATAFATHPEYCDPFQDESCVEDVHDYAWIRLEGPAAIDDATLPPVITDEELHHHLVHAGASVELVGFGIDDDGVLGRKRKVTTTIATFSASGQDLRAGGSGRDSCDGDSGGPALVRLPDGGFALVGVLSRGSKECGRGGIYGAPLPALCWIRDDTGVDVVPVGCESCDCVDLTPREQAHGCGCTGVRPAGGVGWWIAMVIAMSWRHRRRRGRHWTI